jgi:RimJ/RimL family protein N-acetyltransferase
MLDQSKLLLRPATMGDAKNIFDWRNDPWLVPFSSSQKKVEWEEHQKWFKACLDDKEVAIFIIEIEGQGAGQIRYNREQETLCTVAISMLKPFTGKGYGVTLLKKGGQIISRKWPIKFIDGFIRDDNIASISAFKKAGFSEINNTNVPENHVCLRLEVKE